MNKKLISVILVLANVLSLAACSFFDRPVTETADDDNDEPSVAQEKVFDTIDKVAKALAECDYESLIDRCTKEPLEIKEAMPVVEMTDPDDIDAEKPDNKLVIGNMIASTISYEIDEESFEKKALGSKCSVDVIFSYKDYHKVLDKRQKFLGTADFNTLLFEEDSRVDLTFTLEFQKYHSRYLLVNADDLAKLYEYEDTELEYYRSLFDLVENIYLTGDKYDPEKECYTDTDTLEIVLEISEEGQDYVWQYAYRVANETTPKWTDLYNSGWITETGPKEIHVTYTHDEILETGYYCILFYNTYDGTVYGMEFDVFNTQSEASASEETSADISEETTEEG